MIPRYTDLAANERTYLAWMRTSLALIAFGFLLERFDLMMRTLGNALFREREFPRLPEQVGGEAGIVLAALGLAVMILSTMRFIVTTRRIRSDGQESYGFISVLLTGGIFILLALFVMIYITKMVNW